MGQALLQVPLHTSVAQNKVGSVFHMCHPSGPTQPRCCHVYSSFTNPLQWAAELLVPGNAYPLDPNSAASCPFSISPQFPRPLPFSQAAGRSPRIPCKGEWSCVLVLKVCGWESRAQC